MLYPYGALRFLPSKAGFWPGITMKENAADQEGRRY